MKTEKEIKDEINRLRNRHLNKSSSTYDMHVAELVSMAIYALEWVMDKGEKQ